MARVSMGVSDLRRFPNRALDHELALVLSRALHEPLHKFTTDLRRTRRMRVLVLFGASYEEFQVALGQALSRQLDSAQLDWKPLDPELDFVWEEHLDLWERLLAQASEYDAAIVVVPSWGPEAGAKLAERAARFAKPIIFVDQNPDPRQKHPKNVVHVGVSELDGGRCQGKAVVELSRLRPIEKALILTGPTKPDRARGIQEMLKWYLPGCVIDVCGEGAYHRATAASIVYDALRASLKPGRRRTDVVIYTSDSMGLGGNDAQGELAERGYERPLSVSYDGLKEVRDAVAAGAIDYTFIQDPAAMAAAAVETVINSRYGVEPGREKVLVPGYLFGPEGRQHESGARMKAAVERDVLAGLLKAGGEAVQANESKAVVSRYLAEINARLARFQ